MPRLAEPEIQEMAQPVREEPRNASLSLAPDPEASVLLATDIVTVTSREGMRHVPLAWDGRIWTLAPGQSAVVPFQAVVSALGDPRSKEHPTQYSTRHLVGGKGFIPGRYEELSRLFGLYGVRNTNIDRETAHAREMAYKTDTAPDPGAPVSLVKKAPRLEVRDQRMNILTFPAQDPKMIPLPAPAFAPRGAVVPVGDRASALEGEVAALKSQLDRMTALVDSRLGGSENAPDAPTAD